MGTKHIDAKLLSLLKDLPYFSRLGTCISIRLEDYAAQLCGCRSTRYVDDFHYADVNQQFDLLINNLYLTVRECISYIETEHSYKPYIYEMTDLEIEQLLENVLYEMVFFDCRHIFVEYFLVDE